MMCDSRAASFCTASSNLLHKRNEEEVEVTEDNLQIIIITTNSTKQTYNHRQK